MIGLVLTLALLGFVCYLITSYIPMPPLFKTVIYVLVAVVVILYVMRVFGIAEFAIATDALMSIWPKPKKQFAIRIETTPTDATVVFTWADNSQHRTETAQSPHVFSGQTEDDILTCAYDVSKTGYAANHHEFQITTGTHTLTVLLEPLITMTGLTPRGNYWSRGDQVFYFHNEATSFASYKLWLEGDLDALTAHYQQLKDFGFTGTRVFLMCRNLFDLNPVTYGDRFYDQIPAFTTFTQSFGLLPTLVWLPDCVLVMPDINAQIAYVDRGHEACRPVASFLRTSLQNEVPQPPNVTDLTRFTLPDFLLASRGSKDSDNLPPPMPFGAWTEYHTNSAFEWQRKGGHNAMEVGHHCETTERTKPEADPNAYKYEDDGRASAYLSPGSCFHSDALRYSQVVTGQALVCMAAWRDGVQSAELRYQDGNYIHDAECIAIEQARGLLRYYRKTFGGDDWREIPIRP